MTRSRIRAALLAAGAGLATAYAPVSDFAGVIHSYYTGTGAPGVPAPGRKDAIRDQAAPPPSAGDGKPSTPLMTGLFTPLLPARRRRTMAVSGWPTARAGAGGQKGGGGDD